MTESENKKKLNLKRISIFAIFGVVIAMVLGYLGVSHLFEAPKGAGTFGDMFGMLNALFSGLAFSGLIIAILFQSQELDLQKDELKLTRKELEGQREVMTLQYATLERQQFEATFFQMLRLFDQIVLSMDTGKGDAQKTGRDCFPGLVLQVGRKLQSYNKEHGQNYKDSLQRSYGEFYFRQSNEIGHYFRTLYNIIRYVHESNVSDKHIYTRIVRAQLSSSELELLLLNCSCQMGRKFKPLVEEYALLKHISLGGKGLPQGAAEEILNLFYKKHIADNPGRSDNA